MTDGKFNLLNMYNGLQRIAEMPNSIKWWWPKSKKEAWRTKFRELSLYVLNEYREFWNTNMYISQTEEFKKQLEEKAEYLVSVVPHQHAIPTIEASQHNAAPTCKCRPVREIHRKHIFYQHNLLSERDASEEKKECGK